MHVEQSHERRRPRPIDAISGGLCINGSKKVSVYYGFIQRTGHANLFVDDGVIINKRASINFEIARVLEHRWIQRRMITNRRISWLWFRCLAVLMSFVSKIQCGQPLAWQVQIEAQWKPPDSGMPARLQSRLICVDANITIILDKLCRVGPVNEAEMLVNLLVIKKNYRHFPKILHIRPRRNTR